MMALTVGIFGTTLEPRAKPHDVAESSGAESWASDVGLCQLAPKDLLGLNTKSVHNCIERITCSLHQNTMENFSQQSLVLVPYTGYPYHPFLQQKQQEEQMQVFWDQKLEEIKQHRDFNHHEFPISRTRRIMKANPNVQRVSGDALILFVKACEILVEELTLRSWLHAEGNDRQLLQKKDIADAVRETKVFDFLAKIFPRDEVNEGATGFGPGMVGSTVSGVPNYYPVGQPAMPGVIIGNPAIHVVEGATGFGPVMVGSTVSGVPNYYPVGQSAMPGVIIGNPAIHVVAPPVYVQPWVQVWQPVENNPYATGGNDGQGNLGPQS